MKFSASRSRGALAWLRTRSNKSESNWRSSGDMAHFLCGERRVFRRPDERNMASRRQIAKRRGDEISVMSKTSPKNAARKFFARRLFWGDCDVAFRNARADPTTRPKHYFCSAALR